MLCHSVMIATGKSFIVRYGMKIKPNAWATVYLDWSTYAENTSINMSSVIISKQPHGGFLILSDNCVADTVGWPTLRRGAFQFAVLFCKIVVNCFLSVESLKLPCGCLFFLPPCVHPDPDFVTDGLNNMRYSGLYPSPSKSCSSLEIRSTMLVFTDKLALP